MRSRKVCAHVWVEDYETGMEYCEICGAVFDGEKVIY